ncbi:MBL fold metallo-hydrolase [Halostagnicola kamekurae]|uniref:Glyoxylase, beta-lactamase superfamily II n=1 Tax=Halostagnicola kamekurae TaxID=619731 RepID=A0A1I6RWD9_9EURY|nr:MBL fold metallo-hydrolase [Halostagnicola kamekurae]SFS69024.1 Glyoxylase, beta-lactamase superfamily II [Halostagnicola kamekurae]
MDSRRCPVAVETAAPGGTTNAYLLGTDPAVLVDPAARTDDLDELVGARNVEHVVVTHTHPDHVGAAAAYADRTDAALWAHRAHVDRFRRSVGRDPDRLLWPRTTISIGDGSGATDVVTVLDAPGHSSDHVALVVGDGGPIVCGDCAMAEGSVVVGAPDGDMRAYMTTLRRFRATDPPELLPGHGPVIQQPRATLERLLEHRNRRERSVLAAVDSGAETLPGILETAYDKDLTGVRGMARATVRAHLEKLAVEGRLEWDGERARASNSA